MKGALRNQLLHFGIQSAGAGGVRGEVRDGLLQPGPDSRGAGERFFRHEADDFVTQAHVDAAVPEPADTHVDLAVVDLFAVRRRDPCLRLWQ